MENYIIMILLLITGWYLFLQAHKDLDKFYGLVKAKKMIQLIGRRKTRKVYMFLFQILLSE